MAAFLVRARSLPAASADYFGDDSGSPYETSANQVTEAGITTGCTATAYCPNAPTTRGQMASFLVRALQLPPAATDYFADDGGSVHQGRHQRLATGGDNQRLHGNHLLPERRGHPRADGRLSPPRPGSVTSPRQPA